MGKFFQAARPVVTVERRLEFKSRPGLRNEPWLPWDTELFLETRANNAYGAELVNQKYTSLLNSEVRAAQLVGYSRK